jgi:pSer/pThr/pTyr-binding forkhead associated (FHA) protein/S1-C subfamily serine protease
MATIGMKNAQSGEFTLVGLSKPITGQVWDLRAMVANASDRPLSVGRGRGVDIKLLDDSVSRNHASITAGSANELILRDLGSRNGTFVNGIQLDESLLDNGDVIKFGSIVLRVVAREPQAIEDKETRFALASEPLRHSPNANTNYRSPSTLTDDSSLNDHSSAASNWAVHAKANVKEGTKPPRRTPKVKRPKAKPKPAKAVAPTAEAESPPKMRRVPKIRKKGRVNRMGILKWIIPLLLIGGTVLAVLLYIQEKELNSRKELSTPSRSEAPSSRTDYMKKRTVVVLALAHKEPGRGSGFFVNRNHILTNHHVIESVLKNGGEIFVSNTMISEGPETWLKARIVNHQSGGDMDFAVLRLMPEGQNDNFPSVNFSKKIDELAPVISVGYPFDLEKIEPGRVPTAAFGKGEVEKMDAPAGVKRIFHGAKITYGNSGGPLFDKCGRVVGINTGGNPSQRKDPSLRRVYAIHSRDILRFLRAKGILVTEDDTACRQP